MEIKNISYKIIFLIMAILLIIFIQPIEIFAYTGSVSKAKITVSKSSYVYTGNQIKPSITVKVGKEKLKQGTDYTVSYSNNVKAGTAKVTIKGKGILRWGSASKNFTITKADIKNSTISFTRRSFYTGKALKPYIRVKFGSKILEENKDYTLSCSNNIKVGTAKVTIKGKGSFKGSITKTFSINKRSIEDTKITLSNTSYEYTGNAFKPSVTAKYNGMTLKQGIDYTVSYANNINAGKAKVVIQGKGSYSGTTTKTFEIERRDITSARIENMEAYMLGLDSSLKISYNGKILKNKVDYTITIKQIYSLEGKTNSSKHLEWNLKYEIKGINNFRKTKNSNGLGSIYNIVDDGLVDRNSSEYNYNYINKKLNYALNKYYININKVIISEEHYYTNHNVPVLMYEYEDNSRISLVPGKHFNYKKEGNKWIITGTNSFYGTKEIKIK